MIKFLCICLLLIVFSIPAYAQNQAAFCKLWFTHKAAQSVAYQPGVDVHGNPVVPADLGATIAAPILDKITLPVTIDLAQQLNQPLPAGAELDAPVGIIDIYTNGKVVYNGQDLTDETYSVCTGLPVQREAATEIARTTEPAAGKAPEQKKLEDAKKEPKETIIWGEGY